MTTFSTNPHPSDDNISGTVCSLVLSDGTKDIVLSNLRDMIEVNMACFNVHVHKQVKVSEELLDMFR